MRRALGLVLVAAGLVPTGAAAQDEALPTYPPDARWPTAVELRDQLSAVGWHWGAISFGWTGGPSLSQDGPMVSVVGSYRRLKVWSYVDPSHRYPNDLLASWWPEIVGTDWTATMEVLSRLPIDLSTIIDVSLAMSEEQDACRWWPVAGGVLWLDPPEGRRHRITVQQGLEEGCPPEPGIPRGPALPEAGE